MTVKWRKSFTKDYKKLSKVQKIAWLRAWNCFKYNRRHIKLRRHKLKGKYEGLESIDVTPDLRALFKENEDKTGVAFYFIRNHNQLYG
jgi:mRNA-degrading endonuclease YafQ of YafQ-DinJ toxin-antitoxin module